MRSLLFMAFLFLLCQLSSGQTPQETAKKFFETYKEGDTDKALDFLFSNTPYAKEIQEGIEDVKRQLKKTVSQIGVFYGVDLLATKTAGPNLVMMTYLVRHDRQPLTFYIMFYKPNDKWHMQNFKYSNNIDEELEEACKAYRLKENYD